MVGTLAVTTVVYGGRDNNKNAEKKPEKANKHYICTAPSTSLQNTNSHQRSSMMTSRSAFKPVPKDQYTVITPTMRQGQCHAIMRPTLLPKMNADMFASRPVQKDQKKPQGRFFLEKKGFTISQISERTPIDIMKKYVKEHNLDVSFDALKKCLLRENNPYYMMNGFFVNVSDLLSRYIVYFTNTMVTVYDPNYGESYHTTNLDVVVENLEAYPNAIIIFRESTEAFYLVTPPNEQ